MWENLARIVAGFWSLQVSEPQHAHSLRGSISDPRIQAFRVLKCPSRRILKNPRRKGCPEHKVLGFRVVVKLETLMEPKTLMNPDAQTP